MSNLRVLNLFDLQQQLNEELQTADESLFRYIKSLSDVVIKLNERIGGLEKSVEILQKAIRDINER